MNNFGSRIKQLRAERKMTQEELAKILRTEYNSNIDRVMISKWETGYQVPRMYNVVCLAKIFNVSADLGSGAKACRFKSCYPHQTNEKHYNYVVFTCLMFLIFCSML